MTVRPAKHIDAASIIGLTLLVGVVSSLALIAIGLAWHWARWGTLELDYTLPATSVGGFVLADVRQLELGEVRPRLLVSLGIVVLLLTPWVRVLASMLYFAIVERNAKYTCFTAFVLALLTWSLLGSP